jgi:hypothetical protein
MASRLITNDEITLDRQAARPVVIGDLHGDRVTAEELRALEPRYTSCLHTVGDNRLGRYCAMKKLRIRAGTASICDDCTDYKMEEQQ